MMSLGRLVGDKGLFSFQALPGRMQCKQCKHAGKGPSEDKGTNSSDILHTTTRNLQRTPHIVFRTLEPETPFSVARDT